MKYPQVMSMPSAVSNWLDEQLEARGIDAVVYTRYILSLLHSHTVDVLCTEEDSHYTHSKKESRRSNRSYTGSNRSASDWRRHAHADAERIKRTAAVECLLSATEQNCEVESLVDELCEKLKEADTNEECGTCSSGSGSDDADVDAAATKENRKMTPQELAEKYYAAFPALCPRSPPSAESKLLALIPSWRDAAAVTATAAAATTTTSSSSSGSSNNTSPAKRKTVRKLNKQQSSIKNRFKEHNNLKSNGKQRFNCFTKSQKTNNRYNNFNNNWDYFATSNNNNINKKSFMHHQKQQQNQDQRIEANDTINNKDAWNDDDINMYDDLPVDIKDLLDSPTPHDDTVEMMNIANMRDTGNCKRFIPYGTSIIGSIWSNDQDVIFDNKYNSSIDLIDSKFNSIAIDDWPQQSSIIMENEANTMFERFGSRGQRCRRSLFSSSNDEDDEIVVNNDDNAGFLNGFGSMPRDWTASSSEDDDTEFFKDEKLMNRMTLSLIKLNHDKERSGFVEVAPGLVPKIYNPFGIRNKSLTLDDNTSLPNEVDSRGDLLHSESTHFKPIREKDATTTAAASTATQIKYADGSTFMICNNLDKVDYKRSESGTRLLENEYGQRKKYFEYSLGKERSFVPEREFVLKFSVSQNDKCCQTDDEDAVNGDLDDGFSRGFRTILPTNRPPTEDDTSSTSCDDVDDTLKTQHFCYSPFDIIDSTATNNNNNNKSNWNRPDSIMSEVVWKYVEKSCDKCNESNNPTTSWCSSSNSNSNNGDWPSGSDGKQGKEQQQQQIDSEWNGGCLRNIWNGGEVCQKCIKQQTDLSMPNRQLRDDITQDGEQLLSDLSTIQKTYMDDDYDVLIPDVSALIDNNNKRRQHHTNWSFASRLEEDCLMQMASLSDLRAVTL